MNGATTDPDDRDVDGRSGPAANRCLDSAALHRTSPLSTGTSTVGIVVDDLLLPHVAVRVARCLAEARYRRASASDGDESAAGDPFPEPYLLGFLDFDPPVRFDLDRLWTDEAFWALTHRDLLTRLGDLVGIDPGAHIEVGGHELREGDAVGRHHDARRGQRLGIVYFGLDAPVVGGQLCIDAGTGGTAPVCVEPLANRLVAFDARIPHEVRPVLSGVRRTIVGRTWR